MRLGFSGAVEFGSLVPIHDVPPGIDVIGSAVLILEVVGVFPNVHAEHSLPTSKVLRVLIGGGVDGEFAILYEQPRPAGTETAHASSLELLLKAGKGAESRADGRRQVALGLAASALFHELPEKRVVPVAAAVVAHSVADVLWDGI